MILNLNDILNEKGMSVNELHKQTGISRTTLNPLTKSNTVPSKTRLDTLERISETLNIPLSKLISFEHDDNIKYNVKILEKDFNDFSIYDCVYNDRLILQITTNGTDPFLFAAIVEYEPMDYFFKQYESLFQEKDEILDDSNVLDEEKEIKLNEIAKYLTGKALKYKGKVIFRYRPFRISNLTHRKLEFFSIPEKYKNANYSKEKFSQMIGNDEIIELIVEALAIYYNLDSQIFESLPHFGDENYYSLTDKERVTFKRVDSIDFEFYCQTKKLDKSIFYKYVQK